MRIPRIFTPQSLQPGSQVVLEEAASRHLSRALRLGIDAPLVLFNDSGAELSARIVDINKRQVTVALGDTVVTNTESPLAIHLGIAISRGDRMDWVVQKATELGATSITPLLSERTEVKLQGERRDKKIQHWQQVAISACEQCGRNRIPAIAPLQQLEAWLPTVECERKFVLHHRSPAPLDPTDTPRSVTLLIGPEGGLSEAEIVAAQNCGFTPLLLGPRVLRTETAPLAALAIMQNLWGDL